MRLNLALLAALTACALALVTSQDHARKLFAKIEQGEERARGLEVEYGQLQLEQSTWARQTRVQKLAARLLGMHRPDAAHIQVVILPGRAEKSR